METFFRKAGDMCELAPVTIALIVIGGGCTNFKNVLISFPKWFTCHGNRSYRIQILFTIYPSVCVLLNPDKCTPLHLFSLISSVILLLIILLVFRRRSDTDSELSLSRAPLLRKDRPPCHVYGVPCDADPVYAGWWHTDNGESQNKHNILSSHCKWPCRTFGHVKMHRRFDKIFATFW